MKRFIIRDAFLLIDGNVVQGSVVVAGKHIEEIVLGAGVALPPADTIIDARGKYLSTGLINAHTHSYAPMVRSLAPTVALEKWMLYIMELGKLLTPEDCYWNAQLCAMEMIKSGTTCLMDHLAQPFSNLDAAMQGFRDAGIRCVMTPMISDMGYFSSLSMSTNHIPAEEMKDAAFDCEGALQTVGSLLHKWHEPNGLLQVGYGPSGPQRCTDRLLQGCAKYAIEYDTVFQTHLLETKDQAMAAWKLYNKPMVNHLRDLNVLNDHCSMAHGVSVTEEEITLLSEYGCKLVHNPTVNLLLGSGIAPVLKYREKKVPVAIGTDGSNCSGSLSMWQSMKDAAIIHNITCEDLETQGLTPKQVWEMATEIGAKACHLEGKTGRIQAGYAADLVLLNPDLSSNLMPRLDTYWQFVYSTPEECVESVWIDGEQVLDEGKLTRLSEKTIIEEGRKHAGRILEAFNRTGLPNVQKRLIYF